MTHNFTFDDIDTSILPADWEDQIELQPFTQVPTAPVGQPAAFNRANYSASVLKNADARGATPSGALHGSFGYRPQTSFGGARGTSFVLPTEEPRQQTIQEQQLRLSPVPPVVKRLRLAHEAKETSETAKNNKWKNQEEDVVEDPVQNRRHSMEGDGWDQMREQLERLQMEAQDLSDEDSDEDDAESPNSSIESGIAHHMNTSFTSEEEGVDLNDFPSINPLTTKCVPPMEPYHLGRLPDMLPSRLEHLRKNNIPIFVDPTTDNAEMGTLAYFTERDPSEMPEFLKKGWKEISQFKVGGFNINEIRKVAKQKEDPKYQLDTKYIQKDHYHGNHYSVEEFVGAEELSYHIETLSKRERQ